MPRTHLTTDASPHLATSPGPKFGKWGDAPKPRSQHYFVIANKGVKVAAPGGVPIVPEELPTELTIATERSAVQRTPEEEIQYLNQQLHTRVRVERSLRQAKISADERRAEAEQVNCAVMRVMRGGGARSRSIEGDLCASPTHVSCFRRVCPALQANPSPQRPCPCNALPCFPSSHVVFVNAVVSAQDDCEPHECRHAVWCGLGVFFFLTWCLACLVVCVVQARDVEEELRLRAEAARNEAERQARYAKKRSEEILVSKAEVENLYRRARNALAEAVGAQREAEHQAAHAIASLSAAEEMQMDAERCVLM